MFNASNSSWHIIMKARIKIIDIRQKRDKRKKEIEETDPDSNLTSDSNLTRATSRLYGKTHLGYVYTILDSILCRNCEKYSGLVWTEVAQNRRHQLLIYKFLYTWITLDGNSAA